MRKTISLVSALLLSWLTVDAPTMASEPVAATLTTNHGTGDGQDRAACTCLGFEAARSADSRRVPLIDGTRVSSGFGLRLDPAGGRRTFHAGIDISAPFGTPIRATADGIVVVAWKAGGYGNYVRIVHNGGYETGYAHLSCFASGIRVGEKVARGQVIAYVGSTGASTAPHLHYSVFLKGEAIAPSCTCTASPVALVRQRSTNIRAEAAVAGPARNLSEVRQPKGGVHMTNSLTTAALLLSLTTLKAQSFTYSLDTGIPVKVISLCGQNASSQATFVDAYAKNDRGDQGYVTRFLDPTPGSLAVHSAVFTLSQCLATEGTIIDGRRIVKVLPAGFTLSKGGMTVYEAVYTDLNDGPSGSCKRGIFEDAHFVAQLDDSKAQRTPSAKPDFTVGSDGKVFPKAPVVNSQWQPLFSPPRFK
jgi:murein DD-endopeptidase MepM/ murein hydrolase activator NlpD